MIGLTLLVAAALAIFALLVQRRMRFLESELARLERTLQRVEGRIAEPGVDRPAAPSPASALPAAPMPLAAPPPPAEPPPPPRERRAPASAQIETLIGGRLPIWIGGAALVLAGFFLVRFSIESGLLGPITRTLLAALFAAALVAASEAARRIRMFGADPRVGQAFAGAGVASAYGTLYMAAALYHLIAPLPAFVLMLGVTALALLLALRHGPPTAAMAFVGGFAAPLVAGFDAAGIGPLLVYLGLFITALFGLAVQRGWAWLALAAAVAGFGWINFLIYALKGDTLALVGLFAVVLAAGASLALPATGVQRRWLRLAPLVAGCIQLVVLAPSLDFGALAWSFYLVLAAAALFLAWREPLFVPGAVAALALMLALEALALVQGERAATPAAAAVAALLFAIPGHALARRAPGWALIAIGGTAAPLLIAHGFAAHLLPPGGWATLELLAAVAAAHLAWRFRAAGDGIGLVGGTLAAALLAVTGIVAILPDGWLALPLAAAMLALAGWARAVGAARLFALPALPFAAALLAAAAPIADFAALVAESLGGSRLPFLLLPDPGLVLRALALPAVAAIVLLADARHFARGRHAAEVAALLAALLVLYALAKQPLAIADPVRFATWGFVERALLTQACLAAGWGLLRATRLAALGWLLVALGLARILWFDLLVLNPAGVAQAVGALPLLNAAVLHPLIAALWMRKLPPRRATGLAAGALLLAAVLAAVRQAAHGSILTGPVGTVENGGYSAALLALALVWLWRGIAAGSHAMRIAGLGLLTVVTFKVFLIDASALDGVLRILSFLGLGLALIGIGWAYGRFLGRGTPEAAGETGPVPTGV